MAQLKNKQTWNRYWRSYFSTLGSRGVALELTKIEKELYSRYIKGAVINPCCGYGREMLALSHQIERGLGFDFSYEAIEIATRIAKGHAKHIKFKRDTLEYISVNDQYDVMLITPGSLWWIHDLGAITKLASSCGVTMIAVLEFHPGIRRYCDDGLTPREFRGKGIPRSIEGGLTPYWQDCYHNGRPLGESPPISTLGSIVEYEWTYDDISNHFSSNNFCLSVEQHFPFSIREKWFENAVEIKRDCFEYPQFNGGAVMYFNLWTRQNLPT